MYIKSRITFNALYRADKNGTEIVGICSAVCVKYCGWIIYKKLQKGVAKDVDNE